MESELDVEQKWPPKEPRLYFALLARDDLELLAHQVAHIRYFVPGARVAIFHAGQQTHAELDIHDADICPSSRPLPYGKAGIYLWEIFHWLEAQKQVYDYVVSLDLETMLIRPKFGQWLESLMRKHDMAGIHLTSYDKPEDTRNWDTGMTMWREWDKWQPLLKTNSITGTSGTMQVYRRSLVQNMLRSVNSDHLKQVWKNSTLSCAEEIVYPTLAKRCGGRLRSYPSESVRYVRFETSIRMEDVRAAQGTPFVYFLYPVEASKQAPARQAVFHTNPHTFASLLDESIRTSLKEHDASVWKRILEKLPPDYSLPDPAIVQYVLPYQGVEPPASFCWATQEWIESQQGGAAQEKPIYQEIHPEVLHIHPPKPKGLPNQMERLPDWTFAPRHQNIKAFVAVIPGGRVWGIHGSVITPDNKLLYDVSRQWVSSPQEHTIFCKKTLPFVNETSDTVGVLSSISGDNYFHWLHDVLARLDVLERSGQSIDKYLVNRLDHPFQRETLEILEIPQHKILECNWEMHLRVKRLVVPSLPHRSKWGTDYIRKAFGRRLALPEQQTSKRIYISRAKAKHRTVLNEAEVLGVLQPLGFETVVLEDLSVAEQMRLFAAAKIIIAPHGAALANLVFCQPGTKLYEIFSPHFIRDGYWLFSNYYSLDYSFLLAKSGHRPVQLSGTEPYYPGYDNIVIDISELQMLLHDTGVR